MSVVKVSFTIPEEIYALMKTEVPKRKRSAFVSERIEEELRRRKLLSAIKKTYGILKNTGPKEWRTERSTRAWIRKIRNADRKELEKIWK